MPNKKPTKTKNLANNEVKNSLDVLMLPLVNSVNTVSAVKKIPAAHLGDILNKIKSTNEKIAGGNLHHLEDMLINQAHALEAVFYSCTEKMLRGEYLNQVRVYSEIALKAQKQCRNTVMAIAELKNPKQTAFIKQQNNAINQQINNLENKINPANELLEINNESMDTRTQITTVPTYPQLETVDKINRS